MRIESKLKSAECFNTDTLVDSITKAAEQMEYDFVVEKCRLAKIPIPNGDTNKKDYNLCVNDNFRYLFYKGIFIIGYEIKYNWNPISISLEEVTEIPEEITNHIHSILKTV